VHYNGSSRVWQPFVCKSHHRSRYSLSTNLG